MQVTEQFSQRSFLCIGTGVAGSFFVLGKFSHIRYADGVPVVVKYSKNKTKIIMGDNFENITNSTIVNKNFLLEVMEKVDDNTTLLLVKLRKIVEESNNEEAVELFNDLLEELSQQKPRTRRLKSFWHELVSLLPQINNITDITANINSLFEE